MGRAGEGERAGDRESWGERELATAGEGKLRRERMGAGEGWGGQVRELGRQRVGEGEA